MSDNIEYKDDYQADEIDVRFESGTFINQMRSPDDDTHARLAIALRNVLEWQLEAKQGARIPGLKSIGMRTLMLGWALNPALVDGSPSMREFAKACGVNHRTIQRIAASIRERWGITNAFMRDGDKTRKGAIAANVHHHTRDGSRSGKESPSADAEAGVGRHSAAHTPKPQKGCPTSKKARKPKQTGRTRPRRKGQSTNALTDRREPRAKR